MDVLHPVREVQARETALVEHVGIGGAAAEAVTRREAGSLERRMGDPDDGVVTFESVTAIALRHLRLHFAVLEAGREGEGVDHLLDEIGELAFVMRPGLGTQRAPLRDDVASAASLDQADVRRRLVVDASQPQIGDRARGRRNRRAALLRIHAGVGSAAVELHLQGLRVRRAENHVSDRGRLVVDVADACLQALVVECRRTEQADLFLRREQELDSAVRTVLREHTASALEHRGDGGLVVRAEDRAAGVANDAVLDHRFERALRRNRVEVRAEKDRHAAVAVRLDPAVEIPHRGTDGGSCIVLVDDQAELPQVPGDRIGNETLLAGRARQRGQLGEEVDDLGRHRASAEP